MLFLVVAGLTEGIVTPWDLPPPAALLIGIALAGAFWSCLPPGSAGERAGRRCPCASGARRPSYKRACCFKLR